MKVTHQNYKTLLNKYQQEKYLQMAGRERGSIVLKNGILRYANIEEM